MKHHRLLCSIGFAVCLSAMAQPSAALPLQNIQPALPQAIDPGMGRDIMLLSCLAETARGELRKAEEACGKAIAYDARSATAYKLRGYVFLIGHRFERAESDFHVALGLKPNDPESRAGHGQSLNGLGRFDAAVSEFGRAVALDPEKSAYHNGLCWARAGTGRHLALALANCNRAMALAPGAAGPLNSRGLVHLRMGRFKPAVADYAASLQINPRQPSAHFGRGLARLRLGQTMAGAADITEAREGDTEIDDLFQILGILPRTCGRVGSGPCLKGFPARPKPPAHAYPWVVVSLHDDPDQDYLLAVEVERLDIMVGQIAALLHQPHQLPEAPAPQTHRDILDRLFSVTARFNRLLPLACDSGHIAKRDCRAYRPDWNLGSDPAAAIDDVYSRIVPVWSGLCAMHRKQCIVE